MTDKFQLKPELLLDESFKEDQRKLSAHIFAFFQKQHNVFHENEGRAKGTKANCCTLNEYDINLLYQVCDFFLAQAIAVLDGVKLPGLGMIIQEMEVDMIQKVKERNLNESDVSNVHRA